MPSAGQISFVFDQTRMRWMTSLTSGRFQPPLSLTEGNTVDFVFRLSNNGTLFTPALTPVWIFGIKDADTPNGDFLIQVNSATAASGVFTFVVELASAELQTWLATATSQSYAAIQITDSANDIATAPLLCQIAPNQNDTGTTPTSANGTLSVAAGKTVTFPLSLTFPAAAGTNGYHLALLNSTTGTTEWVVDATGSGTVTTTGTMTADTIVLSNGTTVIKSTTTGAGVVTALGNTPNAAGGIVTFSGNIGAATVTSLNAATGTLTLGAQTINLTAGSGGGSTGGSINLSGGDANSCPGGSINLSGSDDGDYNSGGSLNLSGATGGEGGSLNLSAGATSSGGSITTNNGGGSINTSNGGGSITTTAGGSITTGTGNLTGPSASGTVALTTDVIAGQYGGTGVANTGKTITLGASLTTTGAGAATFALGASTQTYTFPTTTATLARTDAVAQTFSAAQTISATTRNAARVTSTQDGHSTATNLNCTFVVDNTGSAFMAASINLCGTDVSSVRTSSYVSATAANKWAFGGNGSTGTVLSITNGTTGAGSGAETITFSSNGNGLFSGTLAITGASTLTGVLNANGGVKFPTSSAGLGSGVWWDNAGVLTKTA